VAPGYRPGRSAFDDVVEETSAHELEGVVYKRLDAPLPARAPKPRVVQAQAPSPGTLVVSAWAPGDHQPDTFYVSRHDASAEQRFAGAVQLGLAPRERALPKPPVRTPGQLQLAGELATRAPGHLAARQ
jgi:hypothetical protein